ncbi:MAG: FAD-dependent oxidoreductase [Gammaproteobacteria bacterium]|nr:FAD-dependent oxidoreductase [Gammaproteobacteria bacterium]
MVVGGGISGLGIAHMAARAGIRPLLLEADGRVGGALCSHLFETPEGPFWAEMGAHTCYNSYGNLLQILEELQLLDTLLAKEKLSYCLLAQRRIRSIPSQLAMFELLVALPRLFSVKKGGSTVAGYFSAIVGRNNYRRVIGPALNAVICQEAGEFPADALFRKKPRRKEVVRNFTGSGGLESFARAIAAQPRLDIRRSVVVTGIERRDDGYLLHAKDGARFETGKLVLAVAPDVAAPLLAQTEPELAAVLSGIGMVEIETVAVILPADASPLEPLAGIIAANDRFFSAVSRDPVPDGRYRAFSFHFRPEGLSRESKLERICEVLDIHRESLLGVSERRNRLPALRLGHDEVVRRVDELLAGKRLGLTGNWFSGVSVEDCLIRSVEECDRLIG